MTPRPRWLPAILKRIRTLAVFRAVRFTWKAREEFVTLLLDEDDAHDVLAQLDTDDFTERAWSEVTGDWLYVFKPHVGGTVVYLKLVLRGACVVVSFHEDEGAVDEEADET